MADGYASNKRKFDDHGVGPPPPTRRATGFSAPIVSAPQAAASPAPGTYGSVPPPPDGIELAKQRAQEIAARIFSKAEANRSKAENGDDSPFTSDYSQKPLGQPIYSHVGMTPPSSIPTYDYQGPSKKIEIPNGRVGVIIGKGGETIKYLQALSGAKIQVTRDMDVDPYSQTRMVEIVGNSEQISKAEQLINDVLSEAEAGGSGTLSARKTGNVSFGAEQFVMKVPNAKVGLVIGKGGESIKSMQAKSGARIQVIPLHLPPGDTSQERTVQIDGTKEQIEAAKQLVFEVTSCENRMRNPPMSGGYALQGYQQPQPPTWGPPQMQQQPGYSYMQQQPGAYPSQPQYGGYPSSYPDQSNQQAQQTATGAGYDYYGQQQQPVAGSAAPSDGNSTGYSYSQQPPNYGSEVAYSDPTYSQPTSGLKQGYGQDYTGSYQSQNYGSTPAYSSQDGTQSGSTQAPPSQQTPPSAQQAPATQGYNGQPPSSATGNYPSQPGYGSQAPSSYGQPIPTTQAGYGYGQPPPAQSGYGQAPLPSGYGKQSGYGYGAGYSQPPTYSTDNAPSASPAISSGAAKTSPQS